MLKLTFASSISSMGCVAGIRSAGVLSSLCHFVAMGSCSPSWHFGVGIIEVVVLASALDLKAFCKFCMSVSFFTMVSLIVL